MIAPYLSSARTRTCAGGGEKVELGEVLHAKALQREDDGGDVAAQDLRHGLLLRLTPRGGAHGQLRAKG